MAQHEYRLCAECGTPITPYLLPHLCDPCYCKLTKSDVHVKHDGGSGVYPLTRWLPAKEWYTKSMEPEVVVSMYPAMYNIDMRWSAEILFQRDGAAFLKDPGATLLESRIDEGIVDAIRPLSCRLKEGP